MMKFLTVKKSLKLRRPAQQANSRCRGLLCQVLPHSDQRRKKSGKVFFRKRVGNQTKKRKVQIKEVAIQVGVMDDFLKIKRGETIPLKVNGRLVTCAFRKASR